MPMLPRSHRSLLVRTEFSSDDAWRAVCGEALREYEDGFRACLEPVSDSAFDGVPWDAVREAVPADDHGAAVLFIADSTAFASPDHPYLSLICWMTVGARSGASRRSCAPSGTT
jgi:hypothetical protein